MSIVVQGLVARERVRNHGIETGIADEGKGGGCRFALAARRKYRGKVTRFDLVLEISYVQCLENQGTERLFLLTRR